MAKVFFVLIAVIIISNNILCKPVKETERNPISADADLTENRILTRRHDIEKRHAFGIINPYFVDDSYPRDSYSLTKTRNRRNIEDCEKLRLCKLHARSGHNFFAAYELYFVNKENARLWDHRPNSIADCETRYSCSDDY